MKRLVYATLLLIFVSSCSSEEAPESLKEYYFPYREFMTPRVYKFVNENNPDIIGYWHMQTVAENGDTLFITEYYDGDFVLMEKMKEKMTPEGAVLEEYCLYNDALEQKCKKVEVDVFSWGHEKEASITWSVSYLTHAGLESVSKTRIFKGKAKSEQIGDRKYEVIRFKDNFKINPAGNGAQDLIRFNQDSYYAKGLGLFHYRRYVDEGEDFDFLLSEVMNEKAWEKLLEEQ